MSAQAQTREEELAELLRVNKKLEEELDALQEERGPLCKHAYTRILFRMVFCRRSCGCFDAMVATRAYRGYGTQLNKYRFQCDVFRLLESSKISCLINDFFFLAKKLYLGKHKEDI